MGDPATTKLVATIAMTAASTALTASQVIEGPRLKELGISISEYGTPLLDVYGESKIDGLPYIHAEPLREKKVQSKTKGGKYNNYKYFFTGAAAVCGHEIDAISRIWFDGKLVFDLTKKGPTSSIIGLFQGLGSDVPVKLQRGKNFRMQMGTDTQMPDPRYEEYCEDKYGPNSANAWRGTPYIFFEEIPLEKLGNRPPTVSALAVRQKTTSYLYDQVPASATNWFLWSPDFMRFINNNEIWDTATHSKIIDLDFTPSGIGTGGTLYVLTDVFVSPQMYVYNNDGTTVVGPFAVPELPGKVLVVNPDGKEDRIFITPQGEVLHWLQEFADADFAVQDVGFATSTVIHDNAGSIFAVGRIVGDPGVYVRCIDGPREGETGEISTSGDDDEVKAIFNDDGNLFVMQGSDARVVDIDTFSVLYSDTLGFSTDSVGLSSTSLWGMTGSTIYEYSLIDLTLIRTMSMSSWVATTPGFSTYDPINHAILSYAGTNLEWRYIDRVGNPGMSLATILEIECGLVNAELTFVGTDPTIKGWSVAPGKVSERISPLLDMHDCDMGPHDFGIRAIIRGTDPTLSIDSSEFVKAGDIRWSAPQVQDVQLPMQVALTYSDHSKDHQINAVVFKRPGSVTDSNRSQQIDMGTYSSEPDEGQQLVDRYGRRKWFEKEEIEFSLTYQHAMLEPNDVRQLVLDGQPRKARLINLHRSGLILQTKWVRDDPRVHDPNAASGPTLEGRDDEELYISGPTKAGVIDIPLLRDSDNTTNVLLRYFAGVYSLLHDWPGATIYQLDPVENEYVGVEDVDSSQKAVWGYATEVLGMGPRGVWDRENSLNINLKGTLVSRTTADIERDLTLNLMYVGDDAGNGELLNFADATLEGDGTWTISTLLRGRRGTEWAIDGHAVGNVCVLGSSLLKDELGVDEIGNTLTYKGQSFGRTLDGAPAFDVPIVARSLKPYAPAYFEARKDYGTGDWDFSWMRRTRVGGNWNGSGTAIPLGETTEAYKVRIYDEDWALVRTIDTAVQSATYTAAQQTTDFGGAQSEIRATVVQVADAVEGFEATLEISAPYVRGLGDMPATAATVSPSLPDGTEVGDFLLLMVETDSGDTIAAPAGYEAVPNAPQNGSDVKLHLFWKRAAFGETAPTVVRTGAHVIARVLGAANVIPRGNPFAATAGGTDSGIALSIPGLTTGSNNCLVIDVVAVADGGVGNQTNSWTNADLTDFAEYGASSANNGFGIAAGIKATAGAVGATTLNMFNTNNTGMAKIALRPA